MALIDTSFLLTDPDFVDPITVIRRRTTINEYGENVLIETSFQTLGSVQAPTGNLLQRLPDAFRMANVSAFWIKGTIQADGTNSRYPDLLVFRGKRYAVQQIFDWMNFGEGYSEGICIVEVPS